VIAAAKSELGFTEKSSQPMKVPLPDLQNLSKIGKLQYLRKAASWIVDKYVFDDYSVNRLLDQILTHQEAQDATDEQLRTDTPAGFPGVSIHSNMMVPVVSFRKYSSKCKSIIISNNWRIQ